MSGKMERLLSGRKTAILAVVVAVVLLGTPAAFAANGKPFLLGKTNVAKAVSTLAKKGPGPALSLAVRPGQPPLKVNSAGKVANLNADRLDGLDSTAFQRSGAKAADADRLDGKDSTAFFGETVTVIGSQSASAGVAATRNVQCPAGHAAVGGGVSGNVDAFDAVTSVPTVGGVPMGQLADGQHGSADGWSGRMQNNDPSTQTFKVTVVCAS